MDGITYNPEALRLLRTVHPDARRPDWRFDLICESVHHTRRPLKSGDCDKWTYEFWKFYKDFVRYNNAFGREYETEFKRRQGLVNATRGLKQLYRRYPLQATAFDIQSQRTVYRYTLESLVLARVPAEAIASRADFRPEVVTWYEKIFFDVRDRLDKNLAIYENVLSRALTTKLASSDIDQLWKYIGYHLGAAALVSFWDPGKMSGQAAVAIEEMMESSSLRNTALTQLLRDPSNFNASEIVNEYVALRGVKRDLDADTDQAKAAKQLLDAMKVSVETIEHARPLAAEELTGAAIQQLMTSQHQKRLMAEAGTDSRDYDTRTAEEKTAASRDAKAAAVAKLKKKKAERAKNK